jgi:hypothetical protein
MRINAIAALLSIYIGFAGAAPRWVDGTYQNPALGFSIRIPNGLIAFSGNQDGPERGVDIPLHSYGHIAVFGEPNSLEWSNPADGVRADLASTFKGCSPARPEISPAHVGQLDGTKGFLLCGDQVVEVLLVFRPGGGPIYWLRLKTTREHQFYDAAILANVAASFKLIPTH